MAFPVFVPDDLVVPPPTNHVENNLVKHLIMKDNKFMSFSYRPISECFMLQFLRKQKGDDVINLLMLVTFEETDTTRESGSTMDVIKRGVCLEGSCYRFLGHTDNQLAEKTCYFMHDSELAIYGYFEKFADFNTIVSVSKRSEYIGILFTEFDKQLTLKENDYFVIDDIKRGSLNFTENCGFMNTQFAAEVKQLEELTYIPSVVKVVYQGFSGVLVLRQDINFVKVEFRDSMKKFSFQHRDLFNNMTSLGVLDFSKPYINGYLGCKDVMLLADRGVPRGYLTQLQEEYYSLLNNLCTSKSQALFYLETTGRVELLERLNKEGLPAVEDQMRNVQAEELEKMRDEDEVTSLYHKKTILRVLVPKSRVVMGVCDPYGHLKYGECYFNPTLSTHLEKDFAEVDKVVVFRQSSYYPGDVIVLRINRKNKDLEHLKDCLVFPSKGWQPHALECGGADLARDKFFVSWDPELTPKWRASPFSYAPSQMSHLGGRIYEQGLQLKFREKAKDYLNTMFGYPDDYAKRMKIKQRQELSQYFATYDSDLPYKFDSIFMKYASSLGPSSKPCQHLHHAFFKSASTLGKGEELDRVMANYEKEYKNLLTPETKPKRCCFIKKLVQYGWIKPFFDPGDDVWNIMERHALNYKEEAKQKALENLQKTENDEGITEDDNKPNEETEEHD